MMIDSVVWAQYINVKDRHTDSHVAIANAVAMHWVPICSAPKSPQELRQCPGLLYCIYRG